ncbi:hypothetical protein ScPMuIL_003154 [Solemya velum]
MVDPSPGRCSQGYLSCLRRRQPEKLCKSQQYNCLIRYCLVLSNNVKRKSSLVTLVSCYVQHGLPTYLWTKLLD